MDTSRGPAHSLLLAAGLVASGLVAACSGPARPAPATTTGTAAGPASPASSGEGSPATTPAAAPARAPAPATAPGPPGPGRTLFEQACGRCHLSGPGDAGARGPSLAGLGLGAAAVQRILHAGSDPPSRLMPAVDPRTLPESGLPVLMEYLRAIGTVR